MKRRDFFGASLAAGTAGLSGLGNLLGQDRDGKQQYIEFRKYLMLVGKKKNELNRFIEKVAIPAWNRAGIVPVGVFVPQAGENQPTLHVLLPHKSLESVVTLKEKLENDSQYQRDGAEFLNTSLDDPKYYRVESSLMRGFKNWPQVLVPELKKQGKSRLFELRTYESHSELFAKKKRHMFNEGGEIDIFLKTGLTPVFFGESLIGDKLPNLIYMVVFENMEEHDRIWEVFRNHPSWKKLSADPQYSGAVSNITMNFLRPAPYSQI